jgi:S1-C subfamily serine protease
MSANYIFLRSSSLKGLVPARSNGTDAVDQYGEIVAEIAVRCGPQAAGLFAEPIRPKSPDPANPTISWYTDQDGAVAELVALDELQRKQAVEKLRAKVQALDPLLKDEHVGPRLASWLNLSSPRDVLVVGGNPVLINWGFLPEQVAQSETWRSAHFEETLGRYLPGLARPPFAPADFERASAATAAVGAAAAPTNTVAPSVASGPAGVAATSTVPAVTTTRPWIAPLVASGLALLVLLILLIPGVLVYPNPEAGAAARSNELEALKAHNQTLDERLRLLREGTSERVCRAPDPAGSGPTLNPTELLPRPIDRVQVEPPNAGNAPQPAMPLVQLLDAAVVFVIGLPTEQARGQAGGVNTGTGFFISDRHIVTNRHVVRGADPNRIFFTNRALGRVQTAKVIAESQLGTPEEPGTDLAVLETEPVPQRIFLKLGPMPAKQTDVVAVGYPGFVIGSDTGLKKLIEGDINSAPDSQHTRGIVTSVTAMGERGFPVITHSAQIAEGNSGGPLTDLCGRVVGVNTWYRSNRSGPQAVNMAQGPDTVREFLQAKGIAFQTDAQPCSPAAVAQAPPPGGNR